MLAPGVKATWSRPNRYTGVNKNTDFSVLVSSLPILKDVPACIVFKQDTVQSASLGEDLSSSVWPLHKHSLRFVNCFYTTLKFHTDFSSTVILLTTFAHSTKHRTSSTHSSAFQYSHPCRVATRYLMLDQEMMGYNCLALVTTGISSFCKLSFWIMLQNTTEKRDCLNVERSYGMHLWRAYIPYNRHTFKQTHTSAPVMPF